MKRKIIKHLLITVCILTAGTVYADDNHYTSYVEVGYGYKVAGAFRNFASGTQKVILKDTMVYSAPTQPIKVELVQKVIKSEEDRFRQTLADGEKILTELMTKSETKTIN